jgi:hypothetical protein
MAAAFPHTFFAEPDQVQPLKVNIHRDLFAALPAGVEPHQAGRFLSWYVNRLAYQQALLEGKGRIDLTGAVVESEIPPAIREQARARWQQLQATDQPGQRGAPAAAALVSTSHLEELYAMAIDAKLEVTLKFTTLPNVKPAGPGKMAFALKTPDGQFVTAEVGHKVWNKLVKAAEEWPAWTAALSGTMGARTEQGFALANPGLQVFERKPKAPAEATPTSVVADPAELAPVPLATAPADPDLASRKPVLSLKNRKATS